MPIISTSCNRIIANHTSLVRAAAITASSQRPSTDVRLLAESRAGGGRIVIEGAYSGAADTDIDVEVLSGTGGALTASVPLINGVGNGVLTIDAIAPAAVPETISFALLHAGDPADPALLEFAGTTLAARTPGAAGNGITLSVARGLVLTPTQYATLEPITAGTTQFDGPAWDWGQPPATGAGIPAAALRVQFDGYPTVHRAWKVWDAGRFTYHLDPAPAWDIPADTRVQAVTGGYTLTLSDGLAPEIYTAVTVHDFLSAVATRSALVDVLGVIAPDRAPGGMAVTDIPLRTDAHALPALLSVKSTLVRGLEGVSVDPGAPTENITIVHAGRGAGGADVWAVRGAVSGDLPSALTGVPYAGGTVGFTVPAIVAPGGVRARISATVALVARDEDEGLPALCFKPLVLGPLASDKTVTYTYRKRPPADCVCAAMPALKLSSKCLGVDDGGSSMALDAEYQSRLEMLYAWNADFVASNAVLSAFSAEFGYVLAEPVDIALAKNVVSVMAEALAEVFESAPARAEWDTCLASVQLEMLEYEGLVKTERGAGRRSVIWSPQVSLSSGVYVRPAAANGRLYRVVQAGETSDTEPDWSSLASPAADGAVLYEVLAPYWSASSAISAGQAVEPGNGFRYVSDSAGVTGAVEPWWAEESSVVDGGVTWRIVTGSVSGRRLVDSSTHERVTNSGYVAGAAASVEVTPATVNVVSYGQYSSTAGADAYHYALIVMDGRDAGYIEIVAHARQETAEANATARAARLALERAVRTPVAATPGYYENVERETVVTRIEIEPYVDKVRAKMDYCRTLAGIVPKSDASAAGDGCWRDWPEETHWWVDESGEYLPAFTNKPYVSVSRDAEGNVYSTREFGFGIVTPCAHRLQDGDVIRIQIRGAANAYTYTEGDQFVVPVIAAAPLAFTGGANGDPTQTWTVRGTVSGTLPDWLFNPAAPAPYAPPASPVQASLAPAGIPFEQGDSIRVSLEGGTLRWRRDGGAWASGDLFGTPLALGDGLTLQAAAGAAPSFVTGDIWSFRALATYGVSRLRQPRIGRAFAFETDGVVLEVDLGAVRDIETVLIALHTLPASATVSISGGEAALGEWTAAPAVRPGAILVALPAATRARYLRVTIAGTVTGASIGWLWAGIGWQPTVGASELTVTRQYGISRGAGLNPAGLYRGRGNGGRWAWRIDEGGALLDDNVDALLELVDHVAEQGLEPVCITPDIRDPARASVAILDADELALVEHNNWQGGRRAVSVDLPFRAVLR